MDYLRDIVRRRVNAEGLTPLATRMGVGVGQVRSVCAGRAPLSTTIEQICDALDLEFYIGPPRPAVARPAPSWGSPRPGRAVAVGGNVAPLPSPSPALEPVSDRRLAELLARLADHWEALDADERREALGEAVVAMLRATGERERGPRWRALSPGSAGG